MTDLSKSCVQSRTDHILSFILFSPNEIRYLLPSHRVNCVYGWIFWFLFWYSSSSHFQHIKYAKRTKFKNNCLSLMWYLIAKKNIILCCFQRHNHPHFELEPFERENCLIFVSQIHSMKAFNYSFNKFDRSEGKKKQR